MESIRPGTLLGNVRVLEVVGQGATATVYRGRHVHLGTDVAVKVLAQRTHGAEAQRNRFLREARIAARLDHPGIVRVFDFGELGDSCYLAMEYVDGATLEKCMESQPGPLGEVAVLKLLRHLAEALQAAHDAGLVHRDLKPANILIQRGGRLKIADFGLTRGSGEPSTDPDGLFNGTPAYMAPETSTPGARVDLRADLYSLGVVAYELAFGRLPYSGDAHQVLAAHHRGTARFDHPTQCSPRLLRIIRRLLAARPEDRFQTAQELQTAVIALDSAAEGRESGAKSGHDEFAVFSRFLENRFGERFSDRPEGRVVHSTLRDRFLVWGLLATVLALVAAGYLNSL